MQALKLRTAKQTTEEIFPNSASFGKIIYVGDHLQNQLKLLKNNQVKCLYNTSTNQQLTLRHFLLTKLFREPVIPGHFHKAKYISL